MKFLEQLKKIRGEQLNYGAIILVGVIACYVVNNATINGPWGFSDTTAYIAAARNLLLGNGYGYPGPDGLFYSLKLNPPLYPFLLAATGLVNSNLVVNARWLSIMLYFLSLMGTGVILYKSSKSISITLAGLIIFASFPKMFAIFSSVMSEPLFLTLYIWAIYILIQYSITSAPRYLIYSALLAGLLPLTRYVGIVIPAAISIFLFFFNKDDWIHRIKKGLLFASISGTPSAAWLAWIYFRVNHSIGGRVLTFSWEKSYANLKLFYDSFMEIIWSSLPFSESLPGATLATKYLILLFFIVTITFITWRSVRYDNGYAMSYSTFVVFGLVGLVYSFSLLVIFIFTIPQPDINDRMLLPLFTSFLFYLFAAVSIWFGRSKRIAQFVLAGIGIMLFFVSTTAFIIKDMPIYTRLKLGNTHTGYHWNNNPIIEIIRTLPPDAAIISNNPDLILLWTNHGTYDVFPTLTPAFLDSSLKYGDDGSVPAQVAFRNNGYLIIISGFNGFTSTFKSTFGKDKSERINTLFTGLIVYREFNGSKIYIYPR